MPSPPKISRIHPPSCACLSALPRFSILCDVDSFESSCGMKESVLDVPEELRSVKGRS